MTRFEIVGGGLVMKMSTYKYSECNMKCLTKGFDKTIWTVLRDVMLFCTSDGIFVMAIRQQLFVIAAILGLIHMFQKIPLVFFLCL